MKQVLFTLMVLLFLSGCSSEAEDMYTLTVNVTYSGSQTISSVLPVIVDIYTDPDYLIAADTSTQYVGYESLSSTSGTVTGDLYKYDYYIIAYVDTDNDGVIDTGEHYTIYNGLDKTATPTAIPLNSDLTVSIAFNDTNTW